jgi:VWFA-related protein
MQRKPIFSIPLLVCTACLAVLVAAVFAVATPAMAGTAAAAPGLEHQALAQIKVIVHYVEGVFLPSKNAYQVQVYLSVLDDAGKPVEGLAAKDFVISEDSRKYDVEDVAVASQPMSIVLLLDNSGSMAGSIGQAKQAANNFIGGLSTTDRVAVVSFNEQIHRETEFSSDLEQVGKVTDQIKVSLSASGTCLFDAAYDAIQLAATEPPGRRAVILLTDGVDEVAGSKKTCSAHTVDDVIGVAAKGNTRIPIYTIALGGRTDERGLARLAEMTGGDSLKSPDASQLTNLFTGLSMAIKSEYVLTYTSSSAPGPHSVVVEVNSDGAKDMDMRDYVLPPLPTAITILSPASGQKIEGDVSIETEVSAQGKVIAQVVFWLDGKEIGWDDTYPYTKELEAGSVAPGRHTLEVEAVGQDNTTLASSKIEYEQVAVAVMTNTPVVVLSATPVLSTPVITSTPTRSSNLIFLVGGGAVFLFLLIVAVVIVALIVRRRGQAFPQPPVMQPGWTGPVVGKGAPSAHPEVPAAPEVLATLAVLQSDDPMMINQELNITLQSTQLGRGAQNDIIFPKDTPVSRQHAIIEQKGYQFWLSEISIADETGLPKRPKYGTFVNDQPLKDAPVPLHNGSIIRLGPRVRLEFRLPYQAQDDRTMDGDVTQDNGGITMDGGGIGGKDARQNPGLGVTFHGQVRHD